MKFAASYALAGAISLSLFGCDAVLGTSNVELGVGCGPGTVNNAGNCVPAADPAAPSFGGVTALSPADPTVLRVDWDPAASATSKPSAIRYSIYVATAPGQQKFTDPDGTVSGATTYSLQNLTIGKTYYVVVRATDEAGHQDSNTVELHAKAQPDTTPPAFAGIVNAAPAAGGGKVTLTWAPATDDLSGSPAITYLAYAAESDPVVGPTPIGTVTGQTSMDVVVPKPLTPFRFVVRARDAAGNVDANTKEVVAISGPDTEAPVFGGCTSATADPNPEITNALTLAWNAGHDDVTPDALLHYDLYAFTTPGPHPLLSDAVAKASVQGVLTAQVTGLQAGTQYYFQCRARDLSGNEGGNPADTLGATKPDVTAPVFGGLISAAPSSSTSYEVALTWLAATDYQTAAKDLVYSVFTSKTPGGENYTLPPAASVTGQTSTTLLARPGETTYFVVRASDEAKNRSATIKELAVTPLISYDWQIQPIFSTSCVPGCHTLNQKTYNPILAPGVSYTFVISDGVVIPGSPNTSSLYQRMASVASPMPPTYSVNPRPNAAQIALVNSWITQGAPGPLPNLGKPPGY